MCQDPSGGGDAQTEEEHPASPSVLRRIGDALVRFENVRWGFCSTWYLLKGLWAVVAALVMAFGD